MRHPHVAESRRLERLDELCLRQSAGDSTGPQFDISSDGVGQLDARHDVRDLQPASWAYDACDLRESPMVRLVEALMNLRSRLTGIATGDQAIFVTRSLFTAAGGYPEIALMEDIAMSKRLKGFGPPLCLKHRLTASARRWEKHGVLRTILLMWSLRLAYWLGADPAKLAVRYDRP